VNALRRVLYLEAALWGLKGLLLAVAPSLVLDSIAGIGPYPEYLWVRAAGIFAMSIALLMVLVAQSADENWFWTWAFVFAQGNLTLLFVAKAVFAAGGNAEVWWICGAASGLMTGLLMWGIARAYGDRQAA
jgi:hypothetical protein